MQNTEAQQNLKAFVIEAHVQPGTVWHEIPDTVQDQILYWMVEDCVCASSHAEDGTLEQKLEEYKEKYIAVYGAYPEPWYA